MQDDKQKDIEEAAIVSGLQLDSMVPEIGTSTSEPTSEDENVLIDRGLAALQNGDLLDAESLLVRAININSRQPAALNGLGTIYARQDRVEEAVEAFSSAATELSHIAAPRFNIGHLMRKKGRLADALEAYNAGLLIEPTRADILLRKARILDELGQIGEALTIYSKVVSLDGSLVDAHIGIARISEETYDLERAQMHIDIALGIEGDNFEARSIGSLIARQEGRIQDALDLLSGLELTLASEEMEAIIRYQLGQLYDLSGRTEEALVEINRANETQRSISLDVDGRKFLEKVKHERAALGSVPPFFDSKPGATFTRRSPVFLVGFPRSGTSLLDVVLDSHPSVVVLEETSAMLETYQEFRKLEEKRGDLMLTLDEKTTSSLRNLYYERVNTLLASPLEDKILIDKFPLNMVWIRIIHQLFPDAALIFAIRHPCDVCFSCYMQRFKLNDAMANFLSLDDTVRLYDEVIGLWQEAERVLPLRIHPVRYEDLVADFRKSIGAVIDFIGLPWNDAVLTYKEHARAGGRVSTPSYHQVIEPIYDRAKGRWLKYKGALEPYFATLDGHAQYLGYTSLQ